VAPGSRSERDEFWNEFWQQWRPIMRRTFRAYNNLVCDRQFSGDAEDVAPSLDLLTLACECCSLDCDATIPIEATLYRSLRADPGRLLVAPGHETEGDRVLVFAPGYRIVEPLEAPPPGER
jgi:hypothetical protein